MPYGVRVAASFAGVPPFAADALGYAADYLMTRPFPGSRKRARSEVQDKSGYVQLTNLGKRNTGRRCSRQKKINKLVEAQMLTRIDRFQYLAGTGAANGSYYLSWTKDAATANYYRYPLYLFDLTCLAENIGTSKLGTYPSTLYGCPFIRLSRQQGGVNNYIWAVQAGRSNGDGGTDFWTPERVPYATTAANAPYEKAFLEWADIRLSFWGAKNVPTTAEVMIVRFPLDNRNPSAWEYDGASYNDNNPVSATATTDPSNQEYNKFWNCQTDNLIGSMNRLNGQAADQDGMTILYRKKISFNPTATYETDTAGHQYTMKLFHTLDSLCVYKSSPTNQTGDGVNVLDYENLNKWYPENPVAGSCHTTLRNRTSRVFLMIKGFTPTLSTNASATYGDPTVHASFDIMVRRKMSVI